VEAVVKLYNDWKRILRYAWSARLAAGAALFSSAQLALPFFDGLVPRIPLAIAAVVIGMGAVVCAVAAVGARVVAQPKTLDKP